MSQKSFYITTTLPYVNSDPHIGFAAEIIRADVIARAQELAGYDVFFNTGTDEHGLKIYQKSIEGNESPQNFVDRYAEKFRRLKDILGLNDRLTFTRTTDPHHIGAAQEFWIRCRKAGYIDKKIYKAKYCPGCELEKTDVEIENGRCLIHQNIDLITIEEENYFFMFSKFTDMLRSFYAQRPNFVVPDFRYAEIKSFVARGLEDFSISRLASKMPWGIPVPGDPDHVMYVWFDALVNYISALGWPEDEKNFSKFWRDGTPIQYCGKDNIRQQAAMWQAMLMAVGLPNTHQVVVDGFVTGDGGVKMSKTLGNTIDPFDVVKEYGTDALRYYVLRELHPFEDSPFTEDRFKEAYNAHLANGLGNVVSRVMKMAEQYLESPVQHEPLLEGWYQKSLDDFNLKSLCDHIWSLIQDVDLCIQREQPFKVVKEDKEKGCALITNLVRRVADIAYALRPVLPVTSEKIQKCIITNTMPHKPLFLRKQ